MTKAPNDVFVVSDSKAGTLTRFEAGGSKPKLTHTAEAGVGSVTFTPEQIEVFRVSPPEEFSVRHVMAQLDAEMTAAATLAGPANGNFDSEPTLA